MLCYSSGVYSIPEVYHQPLNNISQLCCTVTRLTYCSKPLLEVAVNDTACITQLDVGQDN